MNFLCRAVSSLEKIFGEDPCIKGDTYKGGNIGTITVTVTAK